MSFLKLFSRIFSKCVVSAYALNHVSWILPTNKEHKGLHHDFIFKISSPECHQVKSWQKALAQHPD